MFRTTIRGNAAIVFVCSLVIVMTGFALVVSQSSRANAYPIEITDGGPYNQNWSNTGLITTDNDWASVVAIEGFTGVGLVSTTGVDPRTVTADTPLATKQVFANQTNPSTFSSSGVAEFQITDPTVALKGSSTAPAPHLILHFDSTRCTATKAMVVSYRLRDIDGSTADAISPVALHYRIGATGVFTNVASGYVADATSGPSIATRVTNVSATLPVAAVGKPDVTVRIMLTDATAAADEWVGVDDINIKCALTTASSANIAGRVVDEYGTGVSRARVAVFDTVAGTNSYAYTNAFGYFTVTNQPVGHFYIISVRHKYYSFPTNTLQLFEDVGGLVIGATPQSEVELYGRGY